ncbi:DUF6603 domain-containing protein [Frankia sp. QA3]|uniref:DUF6603 domain-containing protein n=1 Tax=Frankia sp. QA3 TaxID=710111 RepID=UPI0012FA6E45|nr:DUF6603 domain-containing protein [Frankia sp. QA3]
MMAARAPMPLSELVNEYLRPLGITLPWPAAFAPILEEIVVDEDAGGRGDTLVTAWTPGFGDETGVPSPARFVLLVTKAVIPGSTLVVGLLDAPLGFDGSRFTLVGEFIPNGALAFPRVQVVLTTKELDVGTVGVLNGVLAGYGVNLEVPLPNAMSAHTWSKYLSVCIPWQLKGGTMPALSIFWASEDESDGNKEKSISFPGMPVSFGPLTLVGVRRGTVRDHWRVELVANLIVGGQDFSLDGLGLAIPVGLKGLKPKPELAGAALSLHRLIPKLNVDAALRYTGLGDDQISYGLAGLVRVQTNAVTVLGAGAFSRAVADYSMVFLYAEALLKPGTALFGPPPFTVIGLSGGFGINATVRAPTAAQLPAFPLMNRLQAAPGSGEDAPPPPEPLEMLNDLVSKTGWVRPEEGSYWIAMGLTFTSFRFVETKALALVEFGNRLNIMILGRTSITLPKHADPSRKVHARLNLDLRFAYLSDQHLLTLEVAVGQGSFLFTETAELTGGLAFCVWTGGGKGGDFVLTLGGYHPQFLVNMPKHYPAAARLGFRWEPSSQVVVQAQGYTALTPGAIMFGGALSARYDLGGVVQLSAWFTAHVDALIQWKPFYLDLAMGISIGVSATLKIAFIKVRIAIEVGITLQFWTPPTGGRVTVKLWFIEFGFDLGSARLGAPPVLWGEFQTQLPAPIRTTAVKGFLADVEKGESQARAARQGPPLASIDGFTLATEAALPTSQITVNGTSEYDGPKIDIRPMRLTGVDSRQLVTITRSEGGQEVPSDLQGWEFTPIRQDLPGALWGTPAPSPEEMAAGPGLVKDRVTGLLIEVPPPRRGGSVGPVTAAALSYEPLDDGDLPLRDATAAGPAPRVADATIQRIAETLAEATAAERTAVHEALARLGLEVGEDTDGSLAEYAELIPRTMINNPLVTAAPVPVSTAPTREPR